MGPATGTVARKGPMQDAPPSARATYRSVEATLNSVRVQLSATTKLKYLLFVHVLHIVLGDLRPLFEDKVTDVLHKVTLDNSPQESCAFVRA